jgi:hypothetical protein
MWKSALEKRSRMRSLIDTRPVWVADFFHKFGPPTTDPLTFPQIVSDSPRQAMWIRAKQTLPDDPTIHCAVLAYASDMGLLGTAKFNHSVSSFCFSNLLFLEGFFRIRNVRKETVASIAGLCERHGSTGHGQIQSFGAFLRSAFDFLNTLL